MDEQSGESKEKELIRKGIGELELGNREINTRMKLSKRWSLFQRPGET